MKKSLGIDNQDFWFLLYNLSCNQGNDKLTEKSNNIQI